MLEKIRQSLKLEEGATAVEYGIMVAAIAAVIVAVVFLLGKEVKTGFQNTKDCIATDGKTCPT